MGLKKGKIRQISKIGQIGKAAKTAGLIWVAPRER